MSNFLNNYNILGRNIEPRDLITAVRNMLIDVEGSSGKELMVLSCSAVDNTTNVNIIADSEHLKINFTNGKLPVTSVYLIPICSEMLNILYNKHLAHIRSVLMGEIDYYKEWK